MRSRAASLDVAAAVASLVLGGLMVGSVALQRSYSASDQLCRAQADLLRVTDYIARDVRKARRYFHLLKAA